MQGQGLSEKAGQLLVLPASLRGALTLIHSARIPTNEVSRVSPSPKPSGTVGVGWVGNMWTC